MPHPEREHELQVAIAMALRERDEARLALANAITARDEEMNESDARADAAEEALAAARRECEGLRKALRLCIDWMPKAEVRSWPPGFRLRDEALKAARAALASPADGEEGK